MTKRKTSQKSRKAVPTPLIIRLIKWMFVAALWGGLLLALLVVWYARDLPNLASAPAFERRTSITIKGADGGVLTRYGDLKAESVSVSELPSHLIYAIIATEDRRFYQHFGLDPQGFARAMVRNLVSMRLVQGGSTITQQLAKNVFLSQERTIKRKIQEAMLALWLEHELTKDEILSAYLNRVYLGSGAYGVEAASQLYFGKSARDVNLRESSLLAGLLKAPSRYSPLRNPDLAMERANVVLSAMADAGYISPDQAKALYDVPPAETSVTAGNSIRYFGDWIVDELGELIGTPQNDLIVETTLVPALQLTAQNEIARVIDTDGPTRHIGQGAALVMKPDGAILAMVGGKDFSQSQFNRATQAVRAPGSSFKPIVYLSALESGWKPDDLILDAPFDANEKYRPENFDGQYMGGVTLETALTKSLNTATVRLMREIGPGHVIDTAQRLGITSPLERDLSLSLGSSGVTLLEMTSAFAAFANNGLRLTPYAITKVTDADGEIYYERPNWRSAARVIDREYVYDMDKMLHSVVREGTGRAAYSDAYDAAGKTGTSQDSRDAWFIGYTDEIVAGVWLGNDDNTPMDSKETAGVTGGSYPARIWKTIALAAQDNNTVRELDGRTLGDGGFGALLGRLLSSSSDDDGDDQPSERDQRGDTLKESERYNN